MKKPLVLTQWFYITFRAWLCELGHCECRRYEDNKFGGYSALILDAMIGFCDVQVQRLPREENQPVIASVTTIPFDPTQGCGNPDCKACAERKATLS